MTSCPRLRWSRLLRWGFLSVTSSGFSLLDGQRMSRKLLLAIPDYCMVSRLNYQKSACKTKITSGSPPFYLRLPLELFFLFSRYISRLPFVPLLGYASIFPFFLTKKRKSGRMNMAFCWDFMEWVGFQLFPLYVSWLNSFLAPLSSFRIPNEGFQNGWRCLSSLSLLLLEYWRLFSRRQSDSFPTKQLVTPL